MDENLTEDELDVIIEALVFYKVQIEGSDCYPSDQARQRQLDRLQSPIAKARLLRKKVQDGQT